MEEEEAVLELSSEAVLELSWEALGRVAAAAARVLMKAGLTHLKLKGK